MERRTLFRAILAGSAGLVAARQAFAQTPAQSGEQPARTKRQRVVYHLDETDRIATAMRNIRNHIEGTGGPGGADIALVVIGPALATFRRDKADGILAADVNALAKDNVRLNACGNTMQAMSMTLADLLPGFVKAEDGGVVKLAALQGDGFAYIRP